jgi:hypothetical protein
MAATYRDLHRGDSDIHRALDGDQMPYRTPRGPSVGSRRPLHVAEVLAVVLTIVLFLAIAYMAHWQWG